MQYFGGKHHQRRWLRENILPVSTGRYLIEPFCGGLSATVALQPQQASDFSTPLIALYTAMREGWSPPDDLSEDAYGRIKDIRDPHDPMTAFAGHGCSFGGKWFGGYARGRVGGYARSARNSLLRKIAATRHTQLINCSYHQLDVRPGDVIYCDPPYARTAHGYCCDHFNSALFCDWVEHWATLGATVFVSEYAFPLGRVVAETGRTLPANGSGGPYVATAVDRLFRVG